MTDGIIMPCEFEWVSLMENICQLEELERRMLREHAQLRREIAELHEELEMSAHIERAAQTAWEVLVLEE